MIKLKDLKKQPLFWQDKGIWYLNLNWMFYFKQSLGIPEEIFIEWTKEVIKKFK